MQIQTNVEKTCVLAEEIGHYITNHGDILDLRSVSNIKQERKAREWAQNRLVNPSDIVTAYKWGVRSRYELANFLGVTEQFLLDWSDSLKRKFGHYLVIDDFIVYFEPLGVMEMLNNI